MNENQIQTGLESLRMEFGSARVDSAIQAVKRFRVEIPSWIFGDFGAGRFGDYTPKGIARTIYEKMDDAAEVNRLVGATPDVAMHILWDFSDDGETPSMAKAEKVAQGAQERGLGIGAINPTYFLKGTHRNTFAAEEKETRDRFIDQTLVAAEIAEKYANNLVTLWFPDGSSYPGQIELRKAHENMQDSMQKIAKDIKRNIKVLLEYKLFEPGTYSTTISDWGSAYILTKSLGENFGVLVDLGHHPHATNIEQIVARLIVDGIAGGFHFNTRYAADDDHSVEPNAEMARIFYELVVGGVVVNTREDKNWAYMIDQCSGREHRMFAILHSVDSLQKSLAKALLVDPAEMEKLQKADEIILANRFFNAALLDADVRPLVAAARLDKNLPADPIAAYQESGYREKTNNERV